MGYRVKGEGRSCGIERQARKDERQYERENRKANRQADREIKRDERVAAREARRKQRVFLNNALVVRHQLGKEKKEKILLVV